VIIDLEVDHGLPKQAWLLRGTAEKIIGRLGANVARFDHGFFEGAWALTERPEALDPAGVFLGSGAVWRSGIVTLISSSHSMQSVYLAQEQDRFWAANSLPLLLAAARPAAFDIRRSRKALFSAIYGLSKYEREIHREPGLRILRFVNAFVSLSDDLDFVELQQRQQADFSTFERYRHYLSTVLAEAAATWGSADAALFLSSGYDSAATAALARVRLNPHAICIDTAFMDLPDDGRAVADALAIPSTLIRKKRRPIRTARWSTVEVPTEVILPEECPEIFEFFCGTHLLDEFMRVPDDLVAGKLVLTGHHGDAVWHMTKVGSNDLIRTVPTCSGLAEFRLRTGFVLIPVPMLAFNYADQLWALSHSDEMKPWRVDSEYDRPIPRRILAEAGVAGDLFATKKKFAAPVFANLHEVARTLFGMQVARYDEALRDWPHLRAVAAHEGSVVSDTA
jgi:hypothetical protein